MCGRLATAFEWEDVMSEFKPDKIRSQFESHYNVAPTQDLPVIIQGSIVFEMFKWGYVPSWAKDSSKAVINARAEEIEEKPYFKGAIKKNRCLILTSGFFEWDKTKTPFYFTIKGKKVYALAGIFSLPKSEVKPTVAIITTTANKTLQEIHDRMPVIIDKKDYKKWIDPTIEDLEVILQMLRPFDDSKMKKIELARTVNSPKNDNPSILNPPDTQGKLKLIL